MEEPAIYYLAPSLILLSALVFNGNVPYLGFDSDGKSIFSSFSLYCSNSTPIFPNYNLLHACHIAKDEANIISIMQGYKKCHQ
jgi:hypothetical protein